VTGEAAATIARPRVEAPRGAGPSAAETRIQVTGAYIRGLITNRLPRLTTPPNSPEAPVEIRPLDVEGQVEGLVQTPPIQISTVQQEAVAPTPARPGTEQLASSFAIAALIPELRPLAVAAHRENQILSGRGAR